MHTARMAPPNHRPTCQGGKLRTTGPPARGANSEPPAHLPGGQTPNHHPTCQRCILQTTILPAKGAIPKPPTYLPGGQSSTPACSAHLCCPCRSWLSGARHPAPGGCLPRTVLPAGQPGVHSTKHGKQVKITDLALLQLHSREAWRCQYKRSSIQQRPQQYAAAAAAVPSSGLSTQRGISETAPLKPASPTQQ